MMIYVFVSQKRECVRYEITDKKFKNFDILLVFGCANRFHKFQMKAAQT